MAKEKATPRRTTSVTTITVPAEVLRAARKHDINVSRAATEAIKKEALMREGKSVQVKSLRSHRTKLSKNPTILKHLIWLKGVDPEKSTSELEINEPVHVARVPAVGDLVAVAWDAPLYRVTDVVHCAFAGADSVAEVYACLDKKAHLELLKRASDPSE